MLESGKHDGTPTTASGQLKERLIEALRAAVPACQLLTSDESLAPYETDALPVYRQLPLVVALPVDASQVQGVLRVCRRLGVPVVPRGGGTSLSGGATPMPNSLVLSLARLNQIINIDPLARTATVQPGVRNIRISEAAAPFDLCYAPDPSSQIACTIGGNVAENAGGLHCLKYGLTVHNIQRVRALSMDGEMLEFGSLAPDMPGLDLLALLIGSEGMFAVVTEITVRLIPKPAMARLVLASFDDVETAGDAVAAIIGEGIIPAGLEMMDKAAIAAVESFVHAGYDLEAAAILLCEADGNREEVAEEVARICTVLQQHDVRDVRVSANEAERLKWWSGRKNALPAAGRLAPDYFCMDGSIPRRAIGKLLKRIQGMEDVYGLQCLNVFHAGDGNLHPLILFDGNDPEQFHRAEDFGADILERCVELGGTITGEHGVGIEKLDSMCVQFTPAERDTFLAIKRAFDPAGLLNADKGIPTHARCAEYGHMHVSGGRLPFPGIERF
ncbi:FAD-linked oxidase C-terminal domain-containing protein [Silvimonas amylolytica]|uniref:Glycolate oxidase n=1 Tax=Silvimonas amylolytica TaxID=449663 RepID=A0ABQ2PH72_9NEIS|nr:FAD-linked oxidase C-terminal domain-containing protein [Silvimonas amylolytica]GGP24640.1 glycolate oxidase [Silvimonas amylolytica]